MDGQRGSVPIADGRHNATFRQEMPPFESPGAQAGGLYRLHHLMNPIKRNLGWLLFSQAATWVVSISLLLVAPRELGDKTFGQLSFVIVYVSFFDLIANMGTNTFLIKSIARDTANIDKYVVNAVAMKLTIATVATGVALVIGALLGLSHTMMVLIVAYCIGMVLNSIGTTIGAALSGLQLMASLARWNMLQCYVGGLGSVAVLLNHGSVVWYAIVFNLSFIIPIGPNLHKLWPYLGVHKRVKPRLWKEILRGGLPFFVLAALLVVYGTIDIPLLQALTGSEEVGWYALAYRWVSVPAFFAATVGTAFFPALSAEGVALSPAFSSLANRAVRICVFVATPAAIGIALIAGPFLHLLYGNEFHQAVPLLRILALHIPIVSMDIILGSVAMAADRQRQWVIVSVIATVFNPLLNFAAIPGSQHLFHNGAIGQLHDDPRCPGHQDGSARVADRCRSGHVRGRVAPPAHDLDQRDAWADQTRSTQGTGRELGPSGLTSR